MVATVDVAEVFEVFVYPGADKRWDGVTEGDPLAAVAKESAVDDQVGDLRESPSFVWVLPARGPAVEWPDLVFEEGYRSSDVFLCADLALSSHARGSVTKSS